MAVIEFPVFDADNHLYETEDAFTRHLPAAHKNLFRFVELNGRKKMVVRGMLSDYIPNPTFEVVARPGSFAEYFGGKNTAGRSLREVSGKPMKSIPAFREPAARLELLDEQGIQASFMIPTLASLVEENLKDDPELTMVALRAFNEWLYEQWTYDFHGRIFPTPIVNPCILDQGIAELERVLDRGAKTVLLRPAPVASWHGTRSPFLPEYDPFWARVQEAGIPVVMHSSDSGYQDYINTWTGTRAEFEPFRPKAFNSVIDAGRTIADTFASAICHGMLARFPGIRLISVENGGNWVEPLLKNLRLTYKKMPREFTEDPVEVFKRHVYVNPFWEESLDGLIEMIGPDRVCFGSDYPHPEGLGEPVKDFSSQISHLPQADVRRIMSDNLFDLMGVSRTAA
jgi:predicted TIM-barrel fold metal-dependent hydrolase